MTHVTNTSAQDPSHHLLGAMVEGTEGYITGQEKAGQTQLVHSDKVPTDLSGQDKADFEALGFVFGDVVEDDPIFQSCTLPPGWSRKATEHDMWSTIVDERGIERVSIFYKAAFYDRSAHMAIARPGGALATSLLYGGSKSADEAMAEYRLFNEDERADFQRGLANMAAQIAETPTVYGKYQAKLDQIRQAYR